MNYGLIVSLIVGIFVPLSWFARGADSAEPSPGARAANTMFGPLAFGFGVGRIVALALHHPSGLTSPRELIALTAGVEFWPAVIAGTGAYLWVHRAGRATTTSKIGSWCDSVVPAIPVVLTMWGMFSATCVIRDGCPGPASPIGLIPPGLSTRTFPVGLVLGLLTVAVAYFIGKNARSSIRPLRTVGLSLSATAAIRVISTALVPSIGSRLPELVTGIAALAFGVALVATGGQHYDEPTESIGTSTAA